MNTHLHVLEAYTELYRVTKEAQVGAASGKSWIPSVFMCTTKNRGGRKCFLTRPFLSFFSNEIPLTVTIRHPL